MTSYQRWPYLSELRPVHSCLNQQKYWFYRQTCITLVGVPLPIRRKATVAFAD